MKIENQKFYTRKKRKFKKQNKNKMKLTKQSHRDSNKTSNIHAIKVPQREKEG